MANDLGLKWLSGASLSESWGGSNWKAGSASEILCEHGEGDGDSGVNDGELEKRGGDGGESEGDPGGTYGGDGGVKHGDPRGKYGGDGGVKQGDAGQ